MDDQYRLIEQNIESLLNESVLDESHETVMLGSADKALPVTMKPKNFLPYKSLEIVTQEGPILGQYTKWSTVESDELNVQQHFVQKRVPVPVLPTAYMNNLTMEMILLNLWTTQLRQNMTTIKRSCSFCKKNGMNFATYTSHALRVNGVLHCPYLLKCQCHYCYRNGHTTSYCPMKERRTVNIGTSADVDSDPVKQR